MTAPVRFYSTNRGVPFQSLSEALLKGQAQDRGLFMPERVDPLTPPELAALAKQSYPAIAHAVLRRFTAGVFDDARLMALCEDAYDYPVPLEHVRDRTYVLRLDRGPTASFKDFAARMMARWMGQLIAGSGERELVILTATSGDTGSAVAHAYHGVPGVQIVVLFPVAEVSHRQRKQMTTLGGNVLTIGIDGKFDDCQAMVKRAFADPDLAALRLSSANSINIGRLLPQSVYFVYAYARLAYEGGTEKAVFSIPSGNFGDMMGAVLAQQMGLPLRRIIVATNANDEVPRFLATGEYRKIEPSRVCISNAMNVGHPSNLARLVDAYGGWLDEQGVLREAPDLERMRRDIYAVSISDEETRAAIRRAHEQHGLVLEPHGAVGWAGLERFLAQYPKSRTELCIAVETAHPAKFPDEIEALIGVEPEVPPSLAGIEEKPEQYDTMSTAYEPFRDLLARRFG
jgi:threonine synthase